MINIPKIYNRQFEFINWQCSDSYWLKMVKYCAVDPFFCLSFSHPFSFHASSTNFSVCVLQYISEMQLEQLPAACEWCVRQQRAGVCVCVISFSNGKRAGGLSGVQREHSVSLRGLDSKHTHTHRESASCVIHPHTNTLLKIDRNQTAILQMNFILIMNYSKSLRSLLLWWDDRAPPPPPGSLWRRCSPH